MKGRLQKGDSSNVEHIIIAGIMILLGFSIAVIGSTGTVTATNATADAATETTPSISSVSFYDSYLTGSEPTTIGVTGTVNTGVCYNHYINIYEREPLGGHQLNDDPIAFTPEDSSFNTNVEFEVPTDETGNTNNFEVEVVQENLCAVGGTETTRSRTDEYEKMVHAADDTAPDPVLVTETGEASETGYTYITVEDSYERYSIDNPPTVRPGETVDIHIEVDNEGGTAGQYSSVQAQFPNFDQPGDDQYIDAVEGPTRSLIGPEATVYNADGSENDSTSWQYERSRDVVFSDGSMYVSFSVTPQEVGDFPVRVRGTFTEDTDSSIREETYGYYPDPDQDGYYMRQITIDVEAENSGPTADAGGSYSVTEGESVGLDASGSTDSDGSITSQSWAVIDGPGYIDSGTYIAPTDVSSDQQATIELAVTDDDGATDTDTTTVAINNEIIPPTADAGGPYSSTEGGTVDLDSAGSSDSDGSITSRSWAVTDGPGYIDSGTYVAPTDLSSDQQATVELTVTDDDGATDTDSSTVSISQDIVPPTADAGGPYSSQEGGTVDLDSAGSSDSDGSITSRSWAVIDGPGYINSGSYVAPNDISSDQQATVELTVTDDDGATDTDSTTVSISQDIVPPTADAGGPYSVTEGESIGLDSAGSFDSDGSITSRSWAVIEGPGYIDSGTYVAPDDISSDQQATVELTVTDDDGATDTETSDIAISDQTDPNQSPTAEFSWSPTNPTTAETIDFDASAATDSDGTITEYRWDFDNDGVTDATGRSVSHSYDQAGEQSVRLTVVDDGGLRDSQTRTVSVAPSEEEDNDFYEPNDELETATYLSPNDQLNARIVDGDIDVYQVSLSEGESLSAAIFFDHDNADLQLAVGNDGSGETVYADSTSVTDDESASITAVADETYYIVVLSENNNTADYTLETDTDDGTETGVVTGTVRDPITGEAISNAEIAIRD